MKKITNTIMILFLILILACLSMDGMAKPLDKASPLLAKQIEENLSQVFAQQNVRVKQSNIILWTPSENISEKNAQSIAWCIPVDIAPEELSGKKDLQSVVALLGEKEAGLLQKEFDAVNKAFTPKESDGEGIAATAHKYAKTTYMYTGVPNNDMRVGVLSTSSDVGIITAKDSIATAISEHYDRDKKKIKSALVLLEWK